MEGGAFLPPMVEGGVSTLKVKGKSPRGASGSEMLDHLMHEKRGNKLCGSTWEEQPKQEAWQGCQCARGRGVCSAQRWEGTLAGGGGGSHVIGAIRVGVEGWA